MKKLFLFTVCVVTFGILPSQPAGQMDDRAEESEMKDAFQTKTNIQNLFDSIAKRDKENSETYRGVLEQEIARDQQTFDAAKHELRTARLRNMRKKNYFQQEAPGRVQNHNIKRETTYVVTRKMVNSSPVSQQIDLVYHENRSTEYEDFVNEPSSDKVKFDGFPLPGLIYILLKFPTILKEVYNRLPEKIKQLPMKLMNRARDRDPIVKWMRVYE